MNDLFFGADAAADAPAPTRREMARESNRRLRDGAAAATGVLIPAAAYLYGGNAPWWVAPLAGAIGISAGVSELVSANDRWSSEEPDQVLRFGGWAALGVSALVLGNWVLAGRARRF